MHRDVKHINWGVRFKNKTFILALVSSVVAFVYQLLALFNVVPQVSQNDILSVAGLLLNVLVALGVVVDPTTKGVTDSKRAQNYVELGGGEQ